MVAYNDLTNLNRLLSGLLALVNNELYEHEQSANRQICHIANKAGYHVRAVYTRPPRGGQSCHPWFRREFKYLELAEAKTGRRVGRAKTHIELFNLLPPRVIGEDGRDYNMSHAEFMRLNDRRHNQ